MTQTIQKTPDLNRILALPRRIWTDEATDEAIEYWTGIFRRPGSSERLWPAQARAFSELYHYGCLVGAIPVGNGKTLISLIGPLVLGLRRPLLLTRASLIQKTKDDQVRYSADWIVSQAIRIESFDCLSRVAHKDMLEKYMPDGIFADEAHRLKSLNSAAVATRVIRHLCDRRKAGDPCKFIPLSGTLIGSKLEDYWHTVGNAMPEDMMFIPYPKEEMLEWGLVLDPIRPDRHGDMKRIGEGALALLCDPGESVHDAFRRRARETPGVLVEQAAVIGASLSIEAVEYEVNDAIDKAFHTLRTAWRTPDGWSLNHAVQVWMHASQLALGFYSRWEPRGPDDWMNARAAWGHEARKILSYNKRNLDSWLQVEMAVAQGLYGDEAECALDDWNGIKNTFEPNPVPIWLDGNALSACIKWAKPRSIIWTEHRPFGEQLSAITGWKYYGPKGLAPDGSYIDNANGKAPIVASVAANLEGRNLQHAFDRNLVTTPPGKADRIEQLAGRTHRLLQPSDEVSCDFLVGCIEHIRSFDRALTDAAKSVGPRQKLLIADINMPDENKVSTRKGSRWGT